ncbi:hypothetical protein ACWEQ7_36915 [Streptomyces sp. NPDC004069]
MVELVTEVAPAGQPWMAGDDLPPFEDEEFVAPQQHPNVLPMNQAGTE